MGGGAYKGRAGEHIGDGWESIILWDWWVGWGAYRPGMGGGAYRGRAGEHIGNGPGSIILEGGALGAVKSSFYIISIAFFPFSFSTHVHFFLLRMYRIMLL